MTSLNVIYGLGPPQSKILATPMHVRIALFGLGVAICLVSLLRSWPIEEFQFANGFIFWFDKIISLSKTN